MFLPLSSTRMCTRILLNTYPKDFIRCYVRGRGEIDKPRLKMLDYDDEEIDELETDFMNVHKSHKEHLAELEMNKEKAKSFMIKHKYFKEKKLPNFLTWADKEQIRYLHKTNPEEWTPETLSEGFPALPETIQKIIKGSWRKEPHKIINHDENVKKNWEHFKKGKHSELPEELVNHLKQFTNRKLSTTVTMPQLRKKEIKVPEHQKIGKEFSSLIEGYLKKKNSDEKEEINQEYAINNEEILEYENSLDKMKKGSKLMTFSELTGIDIHKNKESKSIEISKEDISKIMEIEHNKHNTQVSTTKPKQDLSHLNYPEKITIPKEILKKGYTYKLNDCYYDYDGSFLYRVPGMEK